MMPSKEVWNTLTDITYWGATLWRFNRFHIDAKNKNMHASHIIM